MFIRSIAVGLFLVSAMSPWWVRCAEGAQFVTAVESFASGATAVPGFDDAAAAIGSPERFTGEGAFPSVVSVFSPPFQASEIVSIGEGGHITLRLSHFVTPLAGDPELGVFTNVGLIDSDGDFANETARAAAMLDGSNGTFGIDSAVVELSEDGLSWVGLGTFEFDVPTNGYTDVANPFSASAGSQPTDFGQPFIGQLSDFAGLDYFDESATDVLDVLGGSGGGKWLDISDAGLQQVGFVRFSVPDDGNAQSGQNFELDAVAIANGAVGSVVPQPATLGLFVVTGCGLLFKRRSGRCG